MSEVKRYHLTETGLVEGESLGRLSVVLSSDFDTLQSRLDDTERQRRAEFDAGQAAERLVAELQQSLTAADERVDTAISLLECVLDTGELTREKHLDLEADICRLVTDFWGDRKSARIPSPPRCPDCGYTEQDCRQQMDHHLCGSPEPAPARNP